ncbi:uncharacterized protein [Asterias amurensis]|uniref:uncharacterized protein n=1 Tax=Asterias amurensis TaxID=7602 RepID=UPI003AB405D1
MWIVKDGCLAPVSPNNTYTNTFEFNVIRYKESECHQGQFSCPSGPKCIPQSAVCDGWSDCPEKEDEFGCDVSCGDDYFSCRGIGCAARSSLCDGLHACDDGSDEFDCGQCINGRVDVSKLDSVFITSPLWPNRYPERTQCQYIVVAEVGYYVVVTFLDFDIDQGHDLLFISNNRNFDTASLIASGGQYPITVASTLNEVSILFRSNNVFQKGGFKLQVEQTNEVTCEEGEVYCVVLDLQLCVQNNTSERGLPLCFSSALCGEAYIFMREINYDYELKSPNYPLNYPAGVGCWWLVYAKNRVTPIRIEIIEFLTETVRDVLLFEPYGGTAQSFALHGNSKVRSLVFNNMDSLYISFVGDSTVEYKGFHLEISNVIDQDENVCHDESLIDCDDGSCVLEGAICNGFIDCQGSGLDENQCVNVSCPGFYHCENSTVCQYQFAVCDGRPDCHLGDDEENCDKRCPNVCKCWYDDMDNLKVICEDGWNETTIENIVPISEALTLSGGNFTTLEVGMFKGFTHLNALSLANNGITHLMPGTFADLHNLTFLDISENLIQTLEPDFFSGLSSLETMIAMDVPLRQIGSLAFHGLGSLKTLVLIRDQPNDYPVYVDGGALTDLVSLEKLYVDDYRLCCEFVKSLTNFKESSCETTELQPPLNLCGSLMQNTLLRVSMWVLGLSALIGNAVVIIQRIKESCDRKSHNHPSRVSRSIMVLGLAVSDFMMGVYMLIIAGADVYYGEGYSQIAKQWRSTVVCQIAGVLSVMSSEASVFIVTLISVDCFISIVHPFSRWRLRRKSTIFMVLLLWSIALGLSIGPTVFIRGSDSDIYGLSDVCIGLPLITKPTDFLLKEGAIDNPLGSQTVSIPIGTGQKPAWIFSIILFLGVNLVCFLVVFICYIAIFVRVKRTADKVRVAAHREREIKMAIKMAVIVGTDFACWMPVIVMGILSQTGTVVIGPDMYAWIVVFILPINSSLNPYLYTLYTSITEQRTKSQKISASKRTMNVKCLDTLNSDLSESKSNHDKPVPSIHM